MRNRRKAENSAGPQPKRAREASNGPNENQPGLGAAATPQKKAAAQAPNKYHFRPRVDQQQHQNQQWDDLAGTSNATRTAGEGMLDDEGTLSSADAIEVLKTVFANRNIDGITKLSPGAHLQGMANFIIENAQEFPKNPIKEKKVAIPEDQLEPTFATIDDAMQRDLNYKYKLFDTFMEDFREHWRWHFLRRDNAIYDKQQCAQLLRQHFPYCRTPLIEHLVEESEGRFSTAAWVCFFVESQKGIYLRNFFPHVDHMNWVIMCTLMPQPAKRRANWLPNPEQGPMADSIKEFYSNVRRFRADYHQLFQQDRDRLIPNIEDAVDVNEDEEKFECLVCTSTFPLNRTISCCPDMLNLPPQVVDLIDGQPSTSNGGQLGEGEEDGKHRFCVECLVGHARAATQEMPLAEGGIGLKCMANDCPNAILFSECRFYIPPNVRRQLNARIVEENLGKANLENLERCVDCNFAMIIDAEPALHRVFSCLKCQAEHCRLCKKPWNDAHVGLSCNELPTYQEDRKRAFESKLSETIIRRCHRCNMSFVKNDGCNLMTCRCGAQQCYLCRASVNNYTHFCQHFRNPGQKSCRYCKRKCLLWQSAEDADALAMEMVRQEAESSGIPLTTASTSADNI